MDTAAFANYQRSAVCLDRQYVAINNWANSIATIPPPVSSPPGTPPDNQWIANNIMSGRIPLQPQYYVTRSIAYFMQDSRLQADYRTHLSTANDEATEDTLAQELAAIATDQMPVYCLSEVSQADIDAWLTQNGYPVPAAAMAYRR